MKDETKMTANLLRRPLILLFAAMALAGCITPIHGPKYIDPATFDFKAILPEPPANDSEQTRAELRQILSLQASRTPEQLARVKAESTLTLAAFAPVIGASFDFNKHPVTRTLLRQLELDTTLVVNRAKRHWARTRPYDLEPAINPVVDRLASTAYPAGHPAIAFAWATVLQELFPGKKVELMARANEIGVDRIIAGVHYRSDIAAGRKLGQAIAVKVRMSGAFQDDLAAARKELGTGN
jgi:acid phosphatase (class A)